MIKSELNHSRWTSELSLCQCCHLISPLHRLSLLVLSLTGDFDMTTNFILLGTACQRQHLPDTAEWLLCYTWYNLTQFLFFQAVARLNPILLEIMSMSLPIKVYLMTVPSEEPRSDYFIKYQSLQTMQNQQVNVHRRWQECWSTQYVKMCQN